MPLVVVVGCDGVGKSALTRHLASKSLGYHLAHWSGLARQVGMDLSGANYIRDLRPATRAHYVKLICVGLSEQLIEPQREMGNVVLCESYYFKFLVKERIFGRAARETIEELGLLPVPDLIVDMILDPDVAYTRLKNGPNAYETLTGSSRSDDFCDLQIGVRLHLSEVIASLRVPVLQIDGALTVDHNAAQVDRWIQQELLKLR